MKPLLRKSGSTRHPCSRRGHRPIPSEFRRPGRRTRVCGGAALRQRNSPLARIRPCLGRRCLRWAAHLAAHGVGSIDPRP